MTPNLQFVDKGKVIAEFTGVAFQGGTIWVDETSRLPIKKGSYILDKMDGLIIHQSNSDRILNEFESLVIAQSSDLNLESIPVVKVEENEEKIYKAIFKDVDSCYHFPELKQLVMLAMKEAAQSKGVYSEEQLYQAITKAWLNGAQNHERFAIKNSDQDKIVASIQPKIVIETGCECPITDCVCDNKTLQPITFKGEDGRTHFKIKTV